MHGQRTRCDLHRVNLNIIRACIDLILNIEWMEVSSMVSVAKLVYKLQPTETSSAMRMYNVYISFQ